MDMLPAETRTMLRYLDKVGLDIKLVELNVINQEITFLMFGIYPARISFLVPFDAINGEYQLYIGDRKTTGKTVEAVFHALMETSGRRQLEILQRYFEENE